MKRGFEFEKTVELLGFLHRAEGDQERACAMARKGGHFLRKEAQDIGATGSGDMGGSDFGVLLGGTFLRSLEIDPISVFDKLRPLTRRAAFKTPLFLGGPTTAKVTAEGTAIPVVKFATDAEGLEPQKAAAIAVASNESMQTPEGVEALVGELLQGVNLATDDALLAHLIATADTTESATADPVADLKLLLEGVNLTGYGQLHWIVGPTIANVLATWRSGANGDGLLVFPDLSPVGGSLLGLPCLVTPAAGDSVFLVDPAAIVTGTSNAEIRPSQNAMLEMSDTPAMEGNTPTAAAGKLVSCFQCEATAYLGIRTFAAKLLRTTGCAVLTTVEWSQVGGEGN